MNSQAVLKATGLRTKIGCLHLVITEKFPIAEKGRTFDAWFTRQDWVLREIARMGQEIAGEYQKAVGLIWDKPEQEGLPPFRWDGAPDGNLFGMAILLAGWLANQTASKSRDNQNDPAECIFDSDFRALVDEAIRIGKEMAASEPTKVSRDSNPPSS